MAVASIFDSYTSCEARVHQWRCSLFFRPWHLHKSRIIQEHTIRKICSKTWLSTAIYIPRELSPPKGHTISFHPHFQIIHSVILA